jgi:hypothetical protein
MGIITIAVLVIFIEALAILYDKEKDYAARDAKR